MVRVDLARWHQTSEDLRRCALEATHPRTRERFLALYEISLGSNATSVARHTGRCDEIVLRWVHSYNHRGPDSLLYRHSGGHPPLPSRMRKP